MANQMTPTFIPPSANDLAWHCGGISTTLLLVPYYFNMLVGLLLQFVHLARRPHLAVIVMAFIGLRGIMPRACFG